MWSERFLDGPTQLTQKMDIGSAHLAAAGFRGLTAVFVGGVKASLDEERQGKDVRGRTRLLRQGDRLPKITTAVTNINVARFNRLSSAEKVTVKGE
jgi:hypothetical protein